MVPSVWLENYPTVVLEAQACGVPVIASRVGGLPEMVNDGIDGLLVSPGEPTELADALVRCADEAGFLSRLAAAVRPTVTVDQEGEAWLAVYESALAGAGVSRGANAP